MRVVLILTLTGVVALTGCKKKPPAPETTSGGGGGGGGGISHAGGVGVVDPNEALGGGSSRPNASPPPSYSSSTGGSTAPNQSGNLTVSGGGGAVQAVRKAAARTVNDAQLKQLHLSMFQTFQLDNRVPALAEVMAEAKQNSQLYPLIQDEVIILTGTTRGDGVWAYTRFPQRANEHYVVTAQGVVQMPPEELRQRLQQQNSPIKLDK